VTDHPHDPGGDKPPGAIETSYKDHRVAYKDDEAGFELWIDGRPWGHMVDRLGPEQYYSHLLPFMEYSSPDAIAQAIIDRAGEAWVDEEGDPGHGHGHGGSPGANPD
jgi:hypothetical protein